MYRQRDPDAITAYPRLRTASVGHGPVYRQQSFPLQHQQLQQGARQTNSLERGHHYRYMSDPALLEEREEGLHRYPSDSGRRSAMSVEDYSRSEETENYQRQTRKTKKKKMKHLRSFMHVFLGGLRQKGDTEEEEIAATRDRQRHERNGVAREAVRGAEDGARPRKNSYQGTFPSQRPGLELQPRGLHNHGNTCFMNAVLQCLSNTDQLAEYFVTDAYKGDFNKNPLKPTISTNVTEQFVLLLKCLWSGQYNPVVSARFKEVVGMAAEQYQGSAQHDAQEFFLWLLDNIHEDLNQAALRRYKPLKVRGGRES